MILFGLLITTQNKFKDKVVENWRLRSYAEDLLKAIDQRDKEIEDYQTIIKNYRDKLRAIRINNSITIPQLEHSSDEQIKS